MNRLSYPAFTLLELIITMILGAIVITMAYLILQNADSSWRLFYGRNNRINDVASFHDVLSRDFEYNRCVLRGKQQNLLVVSGDGDTITYDFRDKIYRTMPDFADSFNIAATIKSWTFLDSIPGIRPVKSVNIAVTEPLSIDTMIFLKYYTCQDLLNISIPIASGDQ